MSATWFMTDDQKDNIADAHAMLHERETPDYVQFNITNHLPLTIIRIQTLLDDYNIKLVLTAGKLCLFSKNAL